MRKAYPSDITREQFEIIREELEGAKKKTHPRKYELYSVSIKKAQMKQTYNSKY